MSTDIGNEDFSKLLISDSLLPDIFLVRYAQELSKNALLVYLWLNMTDKSDGFDENTVKRFKIIPDEEVSQTLAELMAAGLINRKEKKFFFDDIKLREVGEYIQAVKAHGEDPEITGLMSDEKERKLLADSISSTFYQGEIPYIFYRLIDKCLYEYKFEGRVCYRLFEEGYEQSIHRSINLMEKMALSWYQNGYTDVKSLEKQLEVSKRTKQLIKLSGKLMRKRLNGLDIDRVKSWAEDLNATEELVTQAFKDNDYRSNLTLKNVGDTLTKWHDQGITTVEEAIKFSEEEHKENKRKVTRKKNVTGVAWATGGEVGIGDSSSKASVDNKTSADNEPEDDIPDDILDMFGDSDEDN